MPRNSNQVYHEMSISGVDAEKVIADLSRRWEFEVSKYGMTAKIVIDKPFTLWNMRRPKASHWNMYFLRSPFETNNFGDYHWTKSNRIMWGTMEDAYDVSISKPVNNGEGWTITFYTDGYLAQDMLTNFFKHYKELHIQCDSFAEGNQWNMRYIYFNHVGIDRVVNKHEEIAMSRNFVSDPNESDY